jgi:hypothetical protein
MRRSTSSNTFEKERHGSKDVNTFDEVKRPKHYHVEVPYEALSSGQGKGHLAYVQCRHIIDGLGLNFNHGNAFKYVFRAGRKEGVNKITDLEKAIQYLKWEIEATKVKS